jgi:hypothetical protein
MSNTLSVYNPIFYAQEALIQLEKALGMAGRVHRGYSKDAQQKGDTISIRRPSTFTAQDAPSTAQDITAGSVDISLNRWKEVKFKLTDKELSFTQDDIIREHIRPAAYALADEVDQTLAALYKNVPWFYDQAASDIAITDLTGVRKVLFNNGVPMTDGQLHLMVDGTAEAGLLALAAFNTANGAGPEGVSTQMRGTIGSKFGLEIFANQNTPSHTPGAAADSTGAINGAAAVGATTIAFDGVTAAGTFKAGDSFVITGNTQRYVFTADVTADGTGAVAAASISPALVAAAADNAVITISLDTHVANLAFHRNAFALATAPLSDMASALGAQVASVADPVTGLSLRSRIYYVGNSSEVHVALDLLYGVKTLDGNLAARLRS